MTLADLARAAAAKGRRLGSAYSVAGSGSGVDLADAVLESFDADVRGHVERDRRIEDERDRVLIAAVKLAEMRPEDGDDAIGAARRHLVDAIDYLEQAVLRFGIVNRAAARLGYGTAGVPVSTER